MRVLVTGASGFVGQALVTALVQRGDAVRAVVRQADRLPAAVESAIVPDLAGDVDYAALLSGVDMIVHLAGIAHIGSGIADKDYDRVNRAATAALAAAANTAKITHFIFVSSIRAQTGPANARTLTEADTPQPTDAYGRSKLAAEAAVRASGVPCTILRPVLIYGPGAKGNMASMARLAASPLPLPLGALTGRRSLLALDNLISAILHLMSNPAIDGKIYVAADPVPVTVPEMITAMRRAAGSNPGLIEVPARWVEWTCRIIGGDHLWQRIGGSLAADPAKLMATGWQPAVGTIEGLTAMVQATSARKSGTASRKTR